jgi:hypothetical protein
VAYWINTRYGLTGDRAITKGHPAVTRIKKQIDAEYGRGRVAAISPQEMEELVAQYLPEVAGD